jgi:hypothetical protein
LGRDGNAGAKQSDEKRRDKGFVPQNWPRIIQCLADLGLPVNFTSPRLIYNPVSPTL